MASDQATESFSNSRRNFIKMAAAGSAVASALSAASATTAQEAAVRLPENEPGSYEPPEYFVIETSDVAVLNKVDLVDILQANQFTGSIMKRIAYALLLLACTCPPSHAQSIQLVLPQRKHWQGTLLHIIATPRPREIQIMSRPITQLAIGLFPKVQTRM